MPGVINSSLGGVVFPAAITGGQVPALGDVDRLHSYTFIRDVAARLATLGEQPEGDGRVWHLPTAEAVTTRRVHRMIEARGRRPLDVFAFQEPRPFGPLDEVFMREYAELFYQYFEDQVMDSSAFLVGLPTGVRRRADPARRGPRRHRRLVRRLVARSSRRPDRGDTGGSEGAPPRSGHHGDFR
jgi:hypothetical protein